MFSNSQIWRQRPFWSGEERQDLSSDAGAVLPNPSVSSDARVHETTQNQTNIGDNRGLVDVELRCEENKKNVYQEIFHNADELFNYRRGYSHSRWFRIILLVGKKRTSKIQNRRKNRQEKGT